MGGFFTTPPNNEPFVPSGQDQYDVPPPSFRLIGQAIGSGLKDAGAVAGAGLDPLNWIAKWLAYIIGWILTKLLFIVAYLIQLVNDIDETAAPGLDAVARASLSHVFQIPMAGASAPKLSRQADFQAAADTIGQDVMQAIIQGVGQAPGTPIQPTSVPTTQFLSKITRIGIEGWLEGTLVDLISAGQVEAVLQLVPIMADILGLGRLSRRVLAPPLKILVEDPYTWRLNLDYRPTLLPEAGAVREFLRGKMDASGLDDALGRLGYSPAAIQAIVNLNSKLLAVGDVDYLIARGQWSVDQGVQTLQNDGYDQATAAQTLSIAAHRRLDTLNQTGIDAYAAAFIAGEIDSSTLDAGLSAFGLSDADVTVYGGALQAKRQLNVKHLTLAEVQTLIKAKIMTVDDLSTWMTRENYPPEEQTLLELWLFGEITSADAAAAAKAAKATATQKAAQAKQIAAEQKQAAAAAKAQVKGVSLADFQKLVENGQRTFADYTAYLTALGLPAQSIQDLTDLLHQTISTNTTNATQHAALLAESDTKHIPLSTIEANVVSGVSTIADLQSFMTANEYAASDIQIAVAYVQQKLDAAKAKAAAKSSTPAATGGKTLSLPDLERAARLGLLTVDAYAADLTAAGYSADQVTILTGILNDQISTDAAAEKKTQDATTKAAAKSISLTDLAKAVVAGLRPIADYQTQLSALGYDTADQQSMVGLLQLQLDHATDVTTAKTSATKALAAQGLSLTSLETAVKLGVMTMAQYTALLQSVGFPAESITILSTSLLAELATVGQTTAKQTAAAKALAAKGISLAQEQDMVKAGLVTLDAYQSWLIGEGYSTDDAAALRALLDLQVQQSNAAAAAHALAVQKAAAKNISLADEEKAVVDGIRTMADYQALLVSLGFNAVDQATLIALLQAKVDAAAAKSSTPALAPTA